MYCCKSIIVALMLLLVVADCRTGENDERKQDSMNEGKGEIEMASTYSTFFADYRRSSFQPVNARCEGEILWSAAYPVEAVSPQAICLFGGGVVLVAENGFSFFSQDGRMLWFQDHIAGSPVGFTDTMIFYQDEHYRLSAVNAAHKQVVENAYFPGPINADYAVRLLWTGKRDYLSVIQFSGGAEELPPKMMVKRTIYNDRLAQWTWQVEGSMGPPPLYLPEQELAVVIADNVYFIKASDGQELSRPGLPLDSPGPASAAADGTVYLTGRSEGRPAVAALKSGQNPAWKWIGDEGTPDLSRRQPPVVTPEGRLYILAGRRLIALQDGRSRWVQSEEEDGFSFATAFVDGLLLAAAGRRLIGFDAEGNTLFDVEFEESIIAPPVGAGDGSILLLTATKLLRVR